MEFSISRFLALLKTEFKVKQKFFLLSILSILAVVFLITILLISQNVISEPQPQVPFLIVYIFSLGLGALLISIYLNDFQTKSKRIQYFTFPASRLEKVVLKWFVTLPIFLGVALAFQFVVRLVTYLTTPAVAELMEQTDMYQNLIWYFTVLFVFGHAILFFFSFLFNRYAILWGGLTIIGLYVLSGVIGGIYRYSTNLSDWGFISIVADQLWLSIIYFSESLSLMATISVLLWVATYFIVKRKQA